jgi:hypothetical protein
VQCAGYPSNLQAERKKFRGFLDFLPSAEAFRKSAIALREMLGEAFYEARY